MKKEIEIIGIYSNLKKLLIYVSLKRKIQFIYLIILTIITSVAEMLSIGAVFPFIKIVTEPDKILTQYNFYNIFEFIGITTTRDLIIIGSIVFAILAVIAGFTRLLLVYLNLRLSMALSFDIYIKLYSKIINNSFSYHISHNSNQILSTITTKVLAVSMVFTHSILIITSSIIILSVILILFLIDKWSTMYALIFFFIVYFFIIRLTRFKLSKNSKLIASKRDIVVKIVQESLGGIRDIIINKSQKYFIDIYNDAVYKVEKANAQNNFIAQSPRSILETISLVFVSIIIIIITTTPQTSEPISNILPILASLALGAQRILPLFNQIYQAHASNQSVTYSLIDVIETLEQKFDLSYFKENKNFKFQKTIILKNLKYSFNNNNTYIFQDLSFKIPKGSRVAITGPSGCGKSTLLDLIMGLLEPTNGNILIDNFLLKKNKKIWQKKIAHVPQFIYLTDATICENIAFGIPKDRIDMKKVIEVSKIAQIHEFIESRERGFNEIVGERGIRISGGQRQRIGIARALYKNPELLILDEATNALDYKTEDRLIKSIDISYKNITILIVSHRPSSLKNCTHFLELKKNKL
jgi:ABC-type multidrug transport system fused ATPase/permease subunit